MKRVRQTGGIFLILLFFILPSTLLAHVNEGAGEALQLYSYKITGTPPVIDGSAFSRNGDPSTKDALDEWKEAYVRQIKLSDGSEASLLIGNTDDTLYIAVNYEHGNNGAGSGVFLYFDEGDNGSDDGEHDHVLGAGNGDRNEATYSVVKGATSELSWDGSAWSADGDGGIMKDFNGARYFFNDAIKVHTHEFAIPLKTTTNDDADNSDLQISLTDELGIYINIYKGGDFYWDKTNGSLTDPSGWADLRLNVDNTFFAFYGTYAANGTPTIDGALTDDAWRGSYRREIVLTNFQGETVNATLWATQDHTGNDIYFGVEVEDATSNAGDYLQIYLEDAPGNGSAARDYVLDDDMEDALLIQGNSATDRYWDNITPAWGDDGGQEAADNHDGKSTYANGKHTFEGVLPYAATGFDIDVSDGAAAGIIIRYHDADASAGEQEFYWDYGANADGIKIDPGSNVYLAVGWPTLQLGAPYLQVIYPEDQKTVEGVVNIRVSAIDENADGIDSVYFYRKQVPNNKIHLTKVADTDEYSGTWDVTSLSNGVDTIVVVAVDDDGIKIDRLVNVTINNDGGSAKAPVIQLTSPSGGAILSGTTTLNFSVASGADSLSEFILLLDGDSIALANSATSYSLATGDYSDGSHSIQFLAKNNADLSSLSQLYSFTFANSPSVTITAPVADSVLSGNATITFTATPVAPATITSTQIFVDGALNGTSGDNATYTLNTTALEEGQHKITVKATDSKGRVTESSAILVTVKNSPAVAITSPSADATISGNAAIAFTATPVAPATIASSQIFVDGALNGTSGDNATYTLNTTTLTDGQHQIVVKVTDSDGRMSESAILVTVKNGPTVVLTAPASDSVVTGTVTVTFTATPSSPATIASCQLYVDGALHGTSGDNLTYALNTTTLNDGQHTLQVRATDSDGRIGVSEIVSVTSFNTPQVAITAPSVETTLAGLDTVLFTTTLPTGVTATTAEIAFNGSSWQAATSLTLSEWNTTDFPDGSHTVQVRVTGSNGKIGYSRILHYRVQNAPAVTIVNPTAGEAINAIYTVLFRASTPTNQSSIVKREIAIDGGNWDTTGVGDSTYSLTTTGMENGAHDIAIKVTDNFGRSTISLHRSFHVDNEAPLTADPKVIYPDKGSIGKSSSAILITTLVQDNIVGLATTNAVVLTSDAISKTGPTSVVMVDDGTSGDLVAGDNVFTASVTVATDSSGAIGFTVTATDKLGNSNAVISSVLLDNIAPTIDSLDYHPDLESAVGKAGNSYNERIILRGGYSDAGGSGIARAVIEMKNSDGDYVNNSPIELSVEDSLFSRILVLVPGQNSVVFTLFDNAGNSVSDTTTITYIEPKATKKITNKGGVLTSQNGVSVSIPSGALLSDEEITITKVPTIDLTEPEDDRINLLGVAHEFGPDGTTFRKPVTITLTYTEADLDRDMDGVQDVDPSKFGLVFWDGESWQNAGKAIVDTVNRRISVTVNHFTVYDIAELDIATPTELIYYWSKNPVKVAEGSFFNYRLPTAGTVSLKILDLAGDVVYQIIADETLVDAGYHSVEWRGQNVSERFAGPGIYVTLFTYTPTGGTKEIIRKPLGLLK